MRGRTLYVAIGIGDSILPGGGPGLARPNPSPSSPLFSSILAIHFSADVERATDGFMLSASHQRKLAQGFPVLLANSWRDWILIRRVADFPDYISEPRPQLPENVRGSNPFDLVGLGHRLYVTDGGRNTVWQVDVLSGASSTLVEFPTIPNPAFPTIGGPFVEAVPTGISTHAGQLLVTLFRGFPFPAGTSSVERIDPATGRRSAFIDGLKTAIDIIAVRSETVKAAHDYLVLQHASSPVLFTAPGTLTRIDGQTGAAVLIAGCLDRPTSMARDASTGAVYITELLTGRVVVVQ